MLSRTIAASARAREEIDSTTACRVVGEELWTRPLTEGGTMHTKVVFQSAKALARIGCVVMRFNFRDVPADQMWYFGGPPNRFFFAWIHLTALFEHPIWTVMAIGAPTAPISPPAIPGPAASADDELAPSLALVVTGNACR